MLRHTYVHTWRQHCESHVRRYSAIDVAPEDDPLASLLEAVSATPAVWSAPINDEAALRVAGAA